MDNPLVNVIFNEGGEVRKIKGKLKSDDGDYIMIKTFTREMAINKRYIIKIEYEGDGKKC